MSFSLKRSYRKNFASQGLIYIDGEEREITIKNLSITGVLVELKNPADVEVVSNALSALPTLDIYLPRLQLVGEADVVRIDSQPDNITIALRFKHISYGVDNIMYKRKAYRKKLSVPGRILLDGLIHDFVSVNVSTDGLMIHLSESVEVEEGATTLFEFTSLFESKELDLKGQIKVIWRDAVPNGGTLLGLQFINMTKNSIKGVPQFIKE